MTDSTSTPRATLIGALAVVLWSTLALFTTQASGVPPLLLLALTFAVASSLFLAVYLIKGQVRQSWQQTPKAALILGASAFSGYHFFYFYAFQHAPPVEAGLIAYLWPILIVLLAACLPGGKWQWSHAIGAAVAFIGTGLILMEKPQHAVQAVGEISGYLAAICCAFIWSGYSVLNRRFQSVPSNSVLWSCLFTSIAAMSGHLLLEDAYGSLSLDQWLAVLMLGIGPVGIAFFCWDHGVKKGNLSLLGVLSYSAPALSTAWLALIAKQPVTGNQLLACLMISGGALLASIRWQRNRNALPAE